ncbi:hypothetical protein Leryth_018944 [Lithospermum erythrorhizon]|nr:hypothetical protein Leryth_018944 [Lithospermum erythrorhizon]
MASNGYGVSEPISTGGPSELDVIQNRELEKFLADAGLYESYEEAIKREEVLGRLDQIVKTWVKNISRAKGFNEQLVQEANAKIFTFGSYRLGVHGPGADIDTLCVGPRHATRKDLDISQESILHAVDDETVRSLNGCRVTDQVLHLVPNIQGHNKVFLHLLWGALEYMIVNKRGVYSNIDIAAENEDDMMNWKGWVESRIRMLTLKIERDTNGVLQCHPHPGEFSDKTKPFRHSYFMGLRRREGLNPQEGEQFDIRMTVDDFKRDVYNYSDWKSTMLICVSHVKKKNIPCFVFPGGVRPSPPPRVGGTSRQIQKFPKSSSGEFGAAVTKRKRRDDEVDSGVSPVESSFASYSSDASSFADTKPSKRLELDVTDTLSNVNAPETTSRSSHVALEYIHHPPIVETCGNSMPTAENVVVQQFQEPIGQNIVSPQAVDELGEDLELKNEFQPLSGVSQANGITSPVAAEVEKTSENGIGSIMQNGGLEELEPLELTVPTSNVASFVSPLKPMIRMSFTSLRKASESSS